MSALTPNLNLALGQVASLAQGLTTMSAQVAGLVRTIEQAQAQGRDLTLDEVDLFLQGLTQADDAWAAALTQIRARGQG